MRTKLIKIGNSFGVRLPKTVIEECGFKEELNLAVRQGAVMITPVIPPRMGWKELLQDEVNARPVKAEGEWEW